MSRGVAIALYWTGFWLAQVLVYAADLRYDSIGTLELFLYVGVAGLGVVWYRADTEAEGVYPPPGLTVLIFGLPIVAVPYYLIRYRGWRRGGLAVAKVLALFVAVSGLGYAAELAIYRLATS